MAYTPLTAEEIQAQAEEQYQSYYDMMRQSAQQSYGTTDLLLSQQIAGLDTTYGKQLEQTMQDFSRAYSQSGREQLSRGMGRSSYALQTLANITQEGAEAKQSVMDAQAAAEANIEAQRTQLRLQLAEKMDTYDASQAADILKRIDELSANEYEKQRQAERDAAADAQWQAEYNEMVRQFNASLSAKKSSGGGGGTKTASQETPAQAQGMTYEQLVAGLSGQSSESTQSNGVGKLFAPYTQSKPTGAAADDEEVYLDLSRFNNSSASPSVADARRRAEYTLGR